MGITKTAQKILNGKEITCEDKKYYYRKTAKSAKKDYQPGMTQKTQVGIEMGKCA